MTGSAHAIEFSGAAFAYRERDVLCDVHLVVREGEFVGVLGPNGSGKTTLVRGATGVVTPRAGVVRVHGIDVGTIARRDLARQIAVVPQEGVPIFPYTVLETVLMGRAPWLGSFAFEGDDDVARARDALAAVDATHLEDRDLSELSGGERQRVVVARALAQNTRIVLADEPTAHLDLRHAVSMFQLFRRLRDERGLAVMLVTHDLNLAARHCDRVVLLAEGTIRADGAPRDVLTAPLLERTFGTRIEVRLRDDGTPFVVAAG